jgi:hypothetical protein
MRETFFDVSSINAGKGSVCGNQSLFLTRFPSQSSSLGQLLSEILEDMVNNLRTIPYTIPIRLKMLNCV